MHLLVYDPEKNHDYDLLVPYRVEPHSIPLQLGKEYAVFVCCQDYQNVLVCLHRWPCVFKIDVCAHHCPEPDGIQWMTDYPKVSKCDDPRPWVSSTLIQTLGSPGNQQQNQQRQKFVNALEQLLEEPHTGIQETHCTDAPSEEGTAPDESR
ncbi:unnamed protein product [Rotaria sp. Silwood2]|nr:unnamed protein product [Rotaria sp. Silwood2]CAF2792529.1 unnamed protein product [Rotaria sp. Silwood2]CAF4148989.1 unnamed protein product [Rotaria sp. Silwood2]CAF4271861.1 unnamed protein product [Rotaria sp. Silwood2]